jgi:ABC-2 type transport system permease protein
MLKGIGFGDLGFELWPIALFAVVVLFIGVARYRQTLD